LTPAGGTIGPNGIARLAGGGLAAFGAACAVELGWRRLPLWDMDGPGPSFFPGFLAICLLGLGLLMAFDVDRSSRRIDPDEMVGGEGAGFATTAKFCLLLVGLILAFPHLGGVLSLSLFVALEMIWVERARLRNAITTAVIAFCVIWLLFVHVLAVPLPAGLLGFLR
jgi:hypothetical protein